MLSQLDLFLSYNWGKDELGRDNGARVSKINEELKKRGYRTLLDQDWLTGSMSWGMGGGIVQATGVIIFITKTYHDKVNGEVAYDNSKWEFHYALKEKTISKTVAVVMEKGMSDTSKWKGAIGMALAGLLYVDMSGELNEENYLNQRMKHLQNILYSAEIKPSNIVKLNNSNLQPPRGIFCFCFIFLYCIEP